MHLLASLPSPGSNSLNLGPLQLRAYGLMIALGIIAAIWLANRRVVEKGAGTADDIGAIWLWAVPIGVLGARLYHVITDWQLFEDEPFWKVFAIWEGGLGVWGGIAAGVIGGVIVARRRGRSPELMLGVVAPSLALAQAIGRWGNWWNQELFGRPTDLPWGLEIDLEHRPLGYEDSATFHPAFLYESLWNFALCGALLVADRRFRIRPAKLFAGYVAGYTFARFFIERLRIDFANTIVGLRVNEWVSVVVFVAAVAYIVCAPNTTPAVAHGADADASDLELPPVPGAVLEGSVVDDSPSASADDGETLDDVRVDDDDEHEARPGGSPANEPPVPR